MMKAAEIRFMVMTSLKGRHGRASVSLEGGGVGCPHTNPPPQGQLVAGIGHLGVPHGFGQRLAGTRHGGLLARKTCPSMRLRKMLTNVGCKSLPSLPSLP